MWPKNIGPEKKLLQIDSQSDERGVAPINAPFKENSLTQCNNRRNKCLDYPSSNGKTKFTSSSPEKGKFYD